MKITKHVIIEQEVDVWLSSEDIRDFFEDHESPDTLKDAMRTLNSVAILLKGVPDSMIDSATQEQRKAIGGFLAEQAERYNKPLVPRKEFEGIALNMKLTKRIRARQKTVRFNWAYKDFLQCTESYRAIRVKHRRATMLKCDWCGHKFEDDEWMGLAQPKANQEGPRRNWALCRPCADLMGAPSRKDNQ